MATINKLATIIFNINENQEDIKIKATMELLYHFLKTSERMIDEKKEEQELEQYVKTYPSMQILNLCGEVERLEVVINNQKNLLKQKDRELDILYAEQRLGLNSSSSIEERIEEMEQFIKDEQLEDFTMDEYKTYIGA